jgi:hypothetical protein
MSAQRKVKVINIALCVQRALALPFAAGGGAHPARCARQVQQTPSKQPALYIPCAFAMSLLYILQSSSTRSSQCLQAQHCFLQKQQSCLALLGAVPCPAAIAGLHGTVLDAHDSLQSCAGCLMSQERRTLLTHVDEYTGVWSDSPQTVPPPQETQLAATKPPVPANMDNYCAVWCCQCHCAQIPGSCTTSVLVFMMAISIDDLDWHWPKPQCLKSLKTPCDSCCQVDIGLIRWWSEFNFLRCVPQLFSFPMTGACCLCHMICRFQKAVFTKSLKKVQKSFLLQHCPAVHAAQKTAIQIK